MIKKGFIIVALVLILGLFSGLIFFQKPEESEEKNFVETTVESVVETVKPVGKCPPGQKYIDYNRPDVPGRCYIPASDAGKNCQSSSECTSGKCWMELDDPIIENCDLQPGINYCPSVTGTCGDPLRDFQTNSS